MEQQGCTTGIAGLVALRVVGLDIAVERRMCVPNCLSILLALRANLLAADRVVVVASFHSHVVEAVLALGVLPSAVGEEGAEAPSVEDGPVVIVWEVVEGRKLRLLRRTHGAGLVDTWLTLLLLF